MNQEEMSIEKREMEKDSLDSHDYTKMYDDIKKKEYFIFVEGGLVPQKGHKSIKEAEKECERLATKPNTLNKKIYIFERVKVFKNIPTLVVVHE